MKKSFYLIPLIILTVSCTKNPGIQQKSFLTGSGVFIVNEGKFAGGTGSLSFYSYDSSRIYNDLFYEVNGWPLGSIPNSMILNDDKAYIIVNNSGKIEVINRNTLESVSTINGLVSPRNVSIISNTKAYVTNLYSDSVAIINLSDNSISGYINLRRYSEAIVANGNKAFVSNMTGPGFISGNEVMVINTITDQVVDSIIVGPEPESMVIDKYKMAWVLCNGGYARNNYAELIGINTATNIIEKRFVFPTKLASPTCLQIDGAGEMLYYLESGVRRMNVDDSELPAAPLITESEHNFYKMGINPVNCDIILTDAIDYEQPGFILLYNREGNLLSTKIADIVPGMVCFKLNDDFQSE